MHTIDINNNNNNIKGHICSAHNISGCVTQMEQLVMKDPSVEKKKKLNYINVCSWNILTQTFDSISVARSGEARTEKNIHIVVRMATSRDLNLAYSAFASDFTTWKVVLLMPVKRSR